MPVGDLTADEPLMALNWGDDTSIEKVSLEGNGNGLPEELAAPADKGESPVEDGDIFFWCWAPDLGDNTASLRILLRERDDNQSDQLFFPMTNREPSCVTKGGWPALSQNGLAFNLGAEHSHARLKSMTKGEIEKGSQPACKAQYRAYYVLAWDFSGLGCLHILNKVVDSGIPTALTQHPSRLVSTQNTLAPFVVRVYVPGPNVFYGATLMGSPREYPYPVVH